MLLSKLVLVLVLVRDLDVVFMLQGKVVFGVHARATETAGNCY